MCRYEFQCQYGSIGWAVGATLGYSVRCCPFLTLAHFIGHIELYAYTTKSTSL